MSWLAAWFIFALVGVGAAPDLGEPQAYKNVSMQIILKKHALFVVYFTKTCATVKFLTLDI